MKFNNRQNTSIVTKEGAEHWLSRSVAVTVSILLIQNNQPYILINQRGPGVPDFTGYWNLVCGYLDYDETIQEAAIREVWEECGVNAIELMQASEAVFFDPPWDVNSSPKYSKQNVTTHHGIVAKVEQLPAVSAEHNEPGETSDIQWLKLEEVSKLDFAFNHKKRIELFIQHVAKNTDFDFTNYLR